MWLGLPIPCRQCIKDAGNTEEVQILEGPWAAGGTGLKTLTAPGRYRHSASGGRGSQDVPASWLLENEMCAGRWGPHSPCDLRSPDSLRFVCDPSGKGKGRHVNLDIRSPLPLPLPRHQTPGSPCRGSALPPAGCWEGCSVDLIPSIQSGVHT